MATKAVQQGTVSAKLIDRWEHVCQNSSLSRKRFPSAAEAADARKENVSGLSPEMMAVTFIEHNCEIYGQLVVYARLNQIVPPASRG